MTVRFPTAADLSGDSISTDWQFFFGQGRAGDLREAVTSGKRPIRLAAGLASPGSGAIAPRGFSVMR